MYYTIIHIKKFKAENIFYRIIINLLSFLARPATVIAAFFAYQIWIKYFILAFSTQDSCLTFFFYFQRMALGAKAFIVFFCLFLWWSASHTLFPVIIIINCYEKCFVYEHQFSYLRYIILHAGSLFFEVRPAGLSPYWSSSVCLLEFSYSAYLG